MEGRMFRRLTIAWLAVLALQMPGTSARTQDALQKRALPPLNAAACQQIAASAGSFAVDTTRRTTQYFTPLFRPGPDGGLRAEDRRNCLQMEGSCIIGRFLYTADGRPSGTRFDLDQVKFVFGMGTGVSSFNTTNALIPCHTVAADVSQYKIGTVIYVPSFRDRLCPQNGQTVDGCFIVGDVGSAIRGRGRFDLFTGECSNYDGRTHVCRDTANAAFDVPVRTQFHVVPRDAPLAQALRSEVDAFINRGWRP
jgi:3D (Asp-Asp-Asp) domain-containing protein